jgi:hypothetical protein
MSVIPSLRVNGVGIFPSGSDVLAGSGSAEAGLGGRLTTSTTSTQTGANTTETDLWSYPLPAGTLSADGQGLEIEAAGTFGANANNKTIRLYFGATQLSSDTTDTSNGNGIAWRIRATVDRTGVTAQLSYYDGLAGGSSQFTARISTPAENTAAAITIRVSGQNGTANAGDIVFRKATVDYRKPGS